MYFFFYSFLATCLTGTSLGSSPPSAVSVCFTGSFTSAFEHFHLTIPYDSKPPGLCSPSVNRPIWVRRKRYFEQKWVPIPSRFKGHFCKRHCFTPHSSSLAGVTGSKAAPGSGLLLSNTTCYIYILDSASYTGILWAHGKVSETNNRHSEVLLSLWTLMTFCNA